jgi:hypothetical protein
MLSKSNFPIEEAEQLLAPLCLDTALFSPTPTGLAKSILDATEPVRRLLRRSGLHDFAAQAQGQSAKVALPAEIWGETPSEVRVTLYRPHTKSGDPRFWLSKLPDLVQPHDLLVICVVRRTLLFLNLSNDTVRRQLVDARSPLRQRLASEELDRTVADQRVINELQAATQGRWLDSIREGSTGVGMTLEHALGITPNSKRAPDLHGYEVKAKVGAPPGRARVRATRQTLFACVPDWQVSALKSSREILERFGYHRAGVLRLYCEVSAKRPNSLGLKFVHDESTDAIHEHWVTDTHSESVATWPADRLIGYLESKHARTLWVYAQKQTESGATRFRYTHAVVTGAPLARKLPRLIGQGAVTMDHLIKQQTNGSTVEKGPLFKMPTEQLHLLFPARVTTALALSGTS